MNHSNTPLTFPARYVEELEQLIEKNSKTITYFPRQVISEPGDCLNYIYYIKSGRTRHTIINLDGDEKILYTLSDGWFFGEAPNDLEKETGLRSIAETKTVLCQIQSETYHQLMDTNKLFRDTILQSYAQKIMILRYEIENLSFNSCKSRLKRLFCSVVDSSVVIDGQWYKLKVKYTQYELGIIVGSARVTISKMINELCNENSIRLINRQLQVHKSVYDAYLETFTSMDYYN